VNRSDGWIRRYWRGLLIAAAVSYGQLQDLGDTDVRAAQQYPYVHMLPDQPDGFHPGEIAGRSILTLPFDSDTRPSLN
jgi:hypothetical protein